MLWARAQVTSRPITRIAVCNMTVAVTPRRAAAANSQPNRKTMNVVIQKKGQARSSSASLIPRLSQPMPVAAINSPPKK